MAYARLGEDVGGVGGVVGSVQNPPSRQGLPGVGALSERRRQGPAGARMDAA